MAETLVGTGGIEFAAVIPAVEGIAAAVGRRGEGDGRAAGHIVWCQQLHHRYTLG